MMMKKTTNVSELKSTAKPLPRHYRLNTGLLLFLTGVQSIKH